MQAASTKFPDNMKPDLPPII